MRNSKDKGKKVQTELGTLSATRWEHRKSKAVSDHRGSSAKPQLVLVVNGEPLEVLEQKRSMSKSRLPKENKARIQEEAKQEDGETR